MDPRAPYQDPQVQRAFRSLHRWATLDMWMQGCLLALIGIPLVAGCVVALWIVLT